MQSKKIAIEPKSFLAYESAVAAGGATVAPLADDVEALIWTDYHAPDQLAELLSKNPQLSWVQLPFAGVDAFASVLQSKLLFTSAKGAYREPVAEHALALSLALTRFIPERVLAKSWGRRQAISLYDSNIVIVGAGGITQELLGLFRPFRAEITVVRNLDEPLPGAFKTVTFEALKESVAEADLVIIAAALTEKTRGLFDLAMLSAMKPSSFLVNVARGPLVVTQDLIVALNEGVIAGAALDVTDPEPLPDGHALWHAKNILITPHTADTKEMVVRLFSERIKSNVAAYLGEGDWVGVVDPNLGY